MPAQDRPSNSVFNKLTYPDDRPKTCVKTDLCKLIDSTVAGKSISQVAHTPRDLAKKSLGEQSRSRFTLKIAEGPPPKKLYMPNFNIYNGRTDPSDHVRCY